MQLHSPLTDIYSQEQWIGRMDRLSALAARWQVEIARIRETATSRLAFGTRRGQRVVIKEVRQAGDEWLAAEVAAAFDGSGMVRVLEKAPGAALVEELVPGTPLADVVNAGNDDQATHILADVILRMLQVSPDVAGVPTAADWGAGFTRYLASGQQQIAPQLVEEAAARYQHLCETQTAARLLHGDLQHYNVLRDDVRGWLAIDPKGVAGEVEMEVCAALRNPHGRPDLLTTAALERRIGIFARVLNVDPARVAAWAYVLALLSAIWTIEDGDELKSDDPALLLSAAARPLL